MKVKEQLPEIGLIGISHKTAPVNIRESFSLSEDMVPELFKHAGNSGLEEIVCLLTCNRVEIYFTSNDMYKSIEILISLLERISSVSGKELDNILYKKFYKDAVLHLLKVASSLDSMVLGENEILGQVKEAYRKSTEHKKTGQILNKLFHQAFKTAKRVRTETEIARSPLSVAFIATELAKSIFEDISKRKALMIGAGEMGELILKYLTKYNISEITIANRSFHNAQRIADGINSDARIIMLEDIKDTAGQVDIIISSAAGPEYVFTKETAKNALKAKGNNPLFIIDIAVPRNIDPAIGELKGVFLYNIDDLQQIADENLKNRLKEVELAERLIESDAADFFEWYEGLAIVPTIVYIKEKFDKIRKNELNRYMKNKLNHLDKSDIQTIENLTLQIMKKTLHDPIMYLKAYQNSSSTQREAIKESVKIIEKLFGKKEI